ncbi:MAG: hypothetical protein JSS27_04360 [Planctomycetes bacterium]|nr:hypothetical protein [Planctomycetota bacterium]
MMTWLFNATLWADINLFRGMGSGFRGKRAQLSSSDALAWLGIAVAVVAAFAILQRFLSRQDRRRNYHNPVALFRQLCRAHGLARPETRCLRRLAEFRGLTQPAELFFEPAHFERGTLEPDWGDAEALLSTLEARLFATEEAPAGDVAVEKSAAVQAS